MKKNKRFLVHFNKLGDSLVVDSEASLTGEDGGGGGGGGE